MFNHTKIDFIKKSMQFFFSFFLRLFKFFGKFGKIRHRIFSQFEFFYFPGVCFRPLLGKFDIFWYFETGQIFSAFCYQLKYGMV